MLPYRKLIPLVELLAEVYDMGPQAKTVTQAYFQLLEKLGSEFSILMDRTIPEIETAGGPVLAEAIRRMREGEVSIAPGYDGEYGILQIFSPEERRAMTGQMRLL